MYSKPSEFLESLDSHGIYGVGAFDECEFDTSSIPTQSPESMRREIIARGVGGTINMDAGEDMFSGWKAAGALAKQFLGSDPGASYQGRGFAFRASLEGLKQAGY